MSKGTSPRMVQKRSRNNKSCLTIDSNEQLLEAIRKGQPKLVKHLLWSNADPNVRDEQKQSGLILACFIKDLDSRMNVIDLLLQKGASVDLQDDSGQTALIKVVILDDITLTKCLLKHGADATLHDKEGNTSLFYASLNGNEKLVHCLITEFHKHQKSVDERNMRGLTPLLVACQNNHLECARVLVMHGNANPMLRDLDHFMSPLDWIQSSSLTWYSKQDLEFLSPRMRKKNYYRQQRKLKGTKILSDYLTEGSMVQCDSPNMFMIKKDDCVSSQSTLSHSSTDSGFSELNLNNSNNKQPKSMFDLPKITAATVKPIHGINHSIPKPMQTSRHELPLIGLYKKPDLYHSMKFRKQLGTSLCRSSKACPNLLEPLVTSSSSSEKLKRLNSISELTNEEDYPDRMTKHHTIPPLKRKPTKPFI